MPVYLLGCTQGHQRAEVRPIAERNRAGTCPSCGAQEERAFGAELQTITINPPKMSFWTQWGDLYDQSPREMARRTDIERYDPSLPVSSKGSARRDLPRPDLRRHLPESEAEAVALGTRRQLAPVEGEQEYT